MSLSAFHPATAAWFRRAFPAPTMVQTQAWPAIQAGRHTLIAAPTGSGKTLAAFLAAIDGLVREGLERGLDDTTRVLYVSPLKALSNDIQKNLDHPLAGIRDELLLQGVVDVPIRAQVRTGDTPRGERERMRREPPHILVTTPESLYLLLTSASGRRMLGTVSSVIVDELHAVAGSKRGAHLMLSLARLDALCGDAQGRTPVRIGLSATQKPIEDMARYLTGGAPCAIVDTGHLRARDLALEVPDSPLTAVMANEVWTEIYERLETLIQNHRTTLIFVNTRRLAERAARHLAERLGDKAVTAHHGSLAREHRLEAEQRLKTGSLKALVATASLELGIDIGEVDLVCQLGSPRSIAALLQRVGRSGHAVDATPKGRLFPLSLDDLAECAALLDAVRHGELDRILIPEAPLDVLAQHLVAEVASREWIETELFELCRRAGPYCELEREVFTNVVTMLAEGFATRRGRRSAYLHRDAVNGRLRPRRGARLTALTNGGAIPDQFDYEVVLLPEGLFIGSLNEDFAFESLPGDIFQLGNTAYRILKIEQGKVLVEDAQGQPPNIPFWFGEAPGRTDELSQAVSRLRQTVTEKLGKGLPATRKWLEDELNLDPAAARQLAEYYATALAALGVLPTRDCIVFERFFDEAGDTHFVIHAPFGSRLNRAWGLALRKRFCRKFNFELQASALEDSIVLSLGPTHSFPLEEVAGYLKAATVREILIQALLDAPLFETRWRWCASIALALQRVRGGKRVPAPLQRMAAADLVAVVFPDQLACLENITGNREVPAHPLVDQALADCLTEAMDIDGLERLLGRLERGEVRLVCRDLSAPSPLSHAILNARPYAFLDDGAAEERRTLAVQQRRFNQPEDAAALGKLDPAAIRKVREEAWPAPRSVDELHDALLVLGFVTAGEMGGEARATGAENPPHPPFFKGGSEELFSVLVQDQRATALTAPGGQTLWVAAERVHELLALFPDTELRPLIAPLAAPPDDPDAALLELVRSRLEGLGPVTAARLAAPLGLPAGRIELALLALEQEGCAMRGRYTGADQTEWCERGLLARIHRYTVQRLRAEIEPVSPADFMRFLFRWQHLDERRGEGTDSVDAALQQLEGFPLAAGALESEILPARVDFYLKHHLDQLTGSGRYAWARCTPPPASARPGKGQAPVRMTPVSLMPRENLALWRTLAAPTEDLNPRLSSAAATVRDLLKQDGASFFADLVQRSGLLRTQVEAALGELVYFGLVSADGFAGLRALITPAAKRGGFNRRRRGGPSVDDAGRWALLRPAASNERETTGHVARVLLKRYGVVFRKLLEREASLPSWRELLYVYRRMEARGELRGGRFVAGIAGEQYALPEAVGLLRETRKGGARGDFITLGAADPLNLTGIVTPGPRVPAQLGQKILYQDGVPVAASARGDVRWLAQLDEAGRFAARSHLLRQPMAAAADTGRLW
ncbi:MAG TPA: DEAD/DEAH box helicase [Gammaproteobacteria bacterium]|nr:DEAD/DEAH box helicase [Gammaproteobacteria bacterium]